MPVPATNINLSEDIGVEVNRTPYIETSLTTASTGGYEAINQNNLITKPDQVVPHQMGEWIGYDHDALPPNNPPTAVITGATVATTGGNVTLFSTSSSDSDGTIVGYDWEDVTRSISGTSANFTVFNPSGPVGARNYTLIVEDDDGAFSSQVTHTITWSAPTPQSTSLRYDLTSDIGACFFSGTVTVWHSGGFSLGTTLIYTSSALTTLSPSGYYATLGAGNSWSFWSSPGWGMVNFC